MIKQVEMVFNSYLAQLFQAKPEIHRFLLNHERRPIVILRTCEQIAQAEASNIKQRFDTAKHSALIFECAKMFANAALTHAEQKALSHAERQRRLDSANRIERIKEEFEADQKEFFSKKLVSAPGSVAK